ncbi:hypothetical protein PUNSTDRAFT_145656 [Punctularia strigosozonata HHB-11173 SS5]|uniref:uncharacterized protein n=1 Tax=Punctularia strigosozonata (strain HHB-11173) TaxID=741275 RepID=UPI00044183C9|nr:uncharacterized protein PUNSTDRAFT_145656 [Punctularia strigosozonata HHB-11173 SS5]EIN05703.1 hypothetical protein PUNSTDRAFT_145656 [Punctularia strigosozonata HHB-11173 SS5]
MRSALASRLATPPPPPSSSAQVKEETRSIKLSFRKGGDRAFYAALKRALTGKAWESTALSKPKPTGSQQPAAGIHGVLTTVSSSAHHTATGMTTALADLEALMAKAKDMVALAADLNDRLTALTSSSTTLSPSSSTTATANTTTTTIIEPEEATFIRSSLTQLGLQIPHAPVTLDMVQDERRWLDALARELAGVLQGSGGTAGGGTKEGRGGRGGRGGLMARRGVMGLDEAWGGWNRARGVALVPPSTFLQVLPHLPAHTRPPVRARKLGSRGVHILHVPEYAPAAFAARLVGLIALAGPRTAVEVAREEEGEGGEGGGGGGGGVPLGLVVEMVREVEEAGEVVRDEEEGRGGAAGGGGEVRWWVNEWRGYVWDGHVFDD